jgi:hypothetical protein
VLIQSYVYGQSVNFQNLTFKLGKDWKEEKKEEKSTTFSYQKASANIKIYYLGKVSSEGNKYGTNPSISKSKSKRCRNCQKNRN